MEDMPQSESHQSRMFVEMLQRHDTEIGKLDSRLSAIAASQQNAEDKVDRVFKILDEIRKDLNRPKPPPNYAAMAGVGVSVLLALGGLVAYTQHSLQRENDLRFQQYAGAITEMRSGMAEDDKREQSDAHALGVLDGTMRALQAQIDREKLLYDALEKGASSREQLIYQVLTKSEGNRAQIDAIRDHIHGRSHER